LLRLKALFLSMLFDLFGFFIVQRCELVSGIPNGLGPPSKVTNFSLETLRPHAIKWRPLTKDSQCSSKLHWQQL
jgi:hypothetical protein